MKIRMESLWFRHPAGAGDRYGCDFLHPWEVEFSNYIRFKDVTSCSHNSVCWQMSAATLGLRVSSCNYTTISDHNQSLLSKLPYFLQLQS